MPRKTLALLLALSATAARAQGLNNPPPDAQPPAAAREPRPPTDPTSPAARAQPRPTPLPHGAILEEVSGTVREVDRKGHRIAVDASGEQVTLSLDRNTMVYTPAGLGTVLDVVPGAQIRAGRNAEFLAYWVQVRGPGGKAEPPSSTPGQGTGPGGGSAAPTTESGAPVNAPPAPPGGVSPGTPGPGAVPSR